jgi:hypothetical protein
VDDGPHNLIAFTPYGFTCKIPFKYNSHVETDFTLLDWSRYPEIISYLLEFEYGDVPV